MSVIEQAMAERERRRRSSGAQAERPGLVERIVDNVVGLDNDYQSAGETMAAALNKGGESMTLGIVGDEAAGRFDQMIGRGDAAERTEFYRQQERDLEENNPRIALASEIAPAFIPGAGAARAVKAVQGVAGRTGAAMGLGAASGATYGAMEGETGEERATGAAQGAALGGLFGAAAPKIGDVLTGIPGGVSRLLNREIGRAHV